MASITNKKWSKTMAKYTIKAEVDEQWFEMLGQLTRHQEGFVWLDVKSSDD